MRFIRALIVLHRTYRKFPLRARAHVFLRFLTCPFLAVVQQIPAGAKLLDIGAGHGILSMLARERGAHATAIDPDARKLRKLEGIHSVIGFDDCIRGNFDVVACVDVLYKIPIAEWDALIARAAERLRPGGLLLIKEHDPTARFKHAWNRLQERLATAIRLTLGESFNYETPAELERRLNRHRFEVTTMPIDRWYPHPHVLYFARKR